ncbi:Hypothetical Protein RSKD131_3421 [Cereibacter sphaeroides KD131]|nr:Hypothetical Protein RSKD131_3421 [Cereibacter sphaeroides KD131]
MHRSPPCQTRCPSRNPWRKTRRPCRSRLWTSRNFPPCPWRTCPSRTIHCPPPCRSLRQPNRSCSCRSRPRRTCPFPKRRWWIRCPQRPRSRTACRRTRRSGMQGPRHSRHGRRWLRRAPGRRS